MHILVFIFRIIISYFLNIPSAVKFQILGCSRELNILKFCSGEIQIFKKISSSRELQISHI